MIVNQAYRFALDLTPTQVRNLASHAGASRKAFNWALSLVKAQLDQREAEKSYGMSGDGLTPYVSWSLPSLRKRWNEVKADVAPWWADNAPPARVGPQTRPPNRRGHGPHPVRNREARSRPVVRVVLL